MNEFQIKSESLQQRCEICHQADMFDAQANFCSRCEVLLPANLLERFKAIYAALFVHEKKPAWMVDASPLRFAALAAILCEGEPEQVAAAIRDTAEEIKKRTKWYEQIRSSLRFIISATLVKKRDRVEDFLAEVARVRARFRELKLRDGGIYEIIAVLLMRFQADKSTIPDAALTRFQEIYEEMKRYHWWLTGPEDFPACANLLKEKDTPQQIGYGIEQIYQGLNQQGFAHGDALQTSANILYLAHLKPENAITRFTTLAQRFRDCGVSIWQNDYDELAILSFLNQDADRVVKRVLEYREEMKRLVPQPDRLMTFNLAASLAFLDLVSADGSRNALSVTKVLLDMQAVINAQAAAAVIVIGAT